MVEISQSPLDFYGGMWGEQAAAHLSLAAAPAPELLLLERAGGGAGLWCHRGLGAI